VIFPATPGLGWCAWTRAGVSRLSGFSAQGRIPPAPPDTIGAEVALLPMDYHPQNFCFNAAGDQLASVHWSLGTAPIKIKERIRLTVVCLWGRTADGQWREVARTPWPGAYDCFTSGRQFFVAVDDPVTPAVQLVELKSKTVILSVPLPPDKQLVAPVALSPDGKLLVVETPAPTDPSHCVLDIWDWAAGRCLQHLEPGVSGLSPVTFSPDGKYLACDCEEKWSSTRWTASSVSASSMRPSM